MRWTIKKKGKVGVYPKMARRRVSAKNMRASEAQCMLAIDQQMFVYSFHHL
jgi:hypothetical protein